MRRAAMYTLLLVDDEEEVTQIIAKKVKWNDLGFSVTGHANNGLKALVMLEEMQPDVVMTDIRMRTSVLKHLLQLKKI